MYHLNFNYFLCKIFQILSPPKVWELKELKFNNIKFKTPPEELKKYLQDLPTHDMVVFERLVVEECHITDDAFIQIASFLKKFTKTIEFDLNVLTSESFYAILKVCLFSCCLTIYIIFFQEESK